jgi:uncharacterized protein YbjT (DUF2867 family)
VQMTSAQTAAGQPDLDGRPVLVTGATGHQGGAVLAALLARGVHVRALVRDTTGERARALAQQGVELCAGDLVDQDRLASAMSGAGCVFGLTVAAGGAEQELAQGNAIIAAAREVGLPHLVLASVASAQQAPQVPHFATKAKLEATALASGVPTTVVAPTWFFENLLAHRADILAGTMALALPADRPLQAVALADLGQLVATVIERGLSAAPRRIELAGDELTPAAMAAALSQAIGAHVHHEETALSTLGPPTGDLGAMYAFLAQTGYHVEIAALREQFPDVRWHSFPQWAAEQRWR